jgi:hypothetical protein
MMRRLALFAWLMSGCGVDDYQCEPLIEYSRNPVPMIDKACVGLMFEGDPVPVEWYPAGTDAYVRESHDDRPFRRNFSCRFSEWHEYPVSYPDGLACIKG